MINGYAKRFLKRKFNEWHSGQMKGQLDDVISIDDVQAEWQFTKFKPIQAGWHMEFYDHIITSKGKEIIDDGWKAAISDALELNLSKISFMT